MNGKNKHEICTVKVTFDRIVSIVILLALAFVGEWLSEYVPGLGSITLALLLAILLGNWLPQKVDYQSTFKFAEKDLLAWATILLGFGLDLKRISSLSPLVLVVIVITVVFTLAVSRVFRNWIGDQLSWMLGAGNGICGNSAIGASSALLAAPIAQVGLAVATVNLLGTLGIFIFPSIMDLMGLSHTEKALFSGAILQSVGHVVATAYSVDQEVGALALLIKMGRILLLGPVLLVIGYYLKRQQHQPGWKQLIPYYVWGFLISSLLTSSGILPMSWVHFFEKTGNMLLLLAMVGIGLGIRIKQLVKLGPKTFIAGSSIFILQMVFVFALILVIRLL